MRLRIALGLSRYFMYEGKRYFAFIYPKIKFWQKGEFTIVCVDSPMPDGSYDFSSETIVKPIIRMKTPSNTTNSLEGG